MHWLVTLNIQGFPGGTKMLHEIPDNLDALIREEKRQVAVELIQDAWDSAINEGIEPGIVAESAIIFALRQLCTEDGDGCVETLVSSLRERHQSGEFMPGKSLQ
ncbi:MAG: hypothetical protein AAF890_10120 [Pseudomonadota bacterium]